MWYLNLRFYYLEVKEQKMSHIVLSACKSTWVQHNFDSEIRLEGAFSCPVFKESEFPDKVTWSLCG